MEVRNVSPCENLTRTLHVNMHCVQQQLRGVLRAIKRSSVAVLLTVTLLIITKIENLIIRLIEEKNDVLHGRGQSKKITALLYPSKASVAEAEEMVFKNDPFVDADNVPRVGSRP